MMSERVQAQCMTQSLVSMAVLVAEMKPAMRYLGLIDFQKQAQCEDGHEYKFLDDDDDDDVDDDDDDDIQEW